MAVGTKKRTREKPQPKTPEQRLVEELLGELLLSPLGASWNKGEGEAFMTACVNRLATARLYVESYDEQRGKPHMNLWALFSQVEGARAEAIGLLIYLELAVSPRFRDGVWSLALTTRRIGRKTALHALTPPTDWTRVVGRPGPSPEQLAAARAMFSEPLT